MEGEDEAAAYALRDPSGDSDAVLHLSPAGLWLLGRMDGTRDLGDLQAEYFRASGEILPAEQLTALIATLDEAGFLDSHGFRARIAAETRSFLETPTRPAAFAGVSYPAEPETLGPWIDDHIARGKGTVRGVPVRACLAPHIDPPRGGLVYGSAYRSLAGAVPRRAVILGIAHTGCVTPFALLDKDFETPFGLCRVDAEFVAALADGLPFDPFAERVKHRREHSLEFQAVYLMRALGAPEACRIVPVLCGAPWLPPGYEHRLPYPPEARHAFVQRLAGLINAETIVIAGVDFAHVGARFGDTDGPGVDAMRASVEEDDRAMMEAIASGSAATFRATIAKDQDRRRVCGYPAITTMLEALPGVQGTVLDYGQAVDPSIDSLVSFGAMAFV